jgi:drug/metabolite transporter (DMT)-like permease
MKLVSDAYRELGKTVLSIGQGMILVMLVALLLKEHVSAWIGLLGLSTGIMCIIGGVFLVQRAHYKQRMQEKK